jgi:hypothetical protein
MTFQILDRRNQPSTKGNQMITSRSAAVRNEASEPESIRLRHMESAMKTLEGTAKELASVTASLETRLSRVMRPPSPVKGETDFKNPPEEIFAPLPGEIRSLANNIQNSVLNLSAMLDALEV